MEKEFVTKNIAKALKELGFKKQCLAYYKGKKLYPIDTDFISFRGLDEMLTPAPLWQQAINWLRKEHGLHLIIVPSIPIHRDNHIWHYHRFDLNNSNNDSEPELCEKYTTCEETQEKAILKAIEIIKNK